MEECSPVFPCPVVEVELDGFQPGRSWAPCSAANCRSAVRLAADAAVQVTCSEPYEWTDPTIDEWEFSAAVKARARQRALPREFDAHARRPCWSILWLQRSQRHNPCGTYHTSGPPLSPMCPCMHQRPTCRPLSCWPRIF